MRLAVVLPNWIGDLAMATPALRALRRHIGPQSVLYGVMQPYGTGLLDGLPWIDEYLYYHPRGWQGRFSLLRLAVQLRARRLDAIVLFTNCLRSAVFARASGAPRRVGYARNRRGALLTDALAPPHDGNRLTPVSPVDYYLRLIQAIGCPAERRQLELATTSEDERAADRLWERAAWNRRDAVITMHPGGAYGPAKRWPAEKFAQLACRLVDQCGASVLVLCGPSEQPLAREIVAQAASPRVRSLAGAPISLGLSKACVRRSRLLITNDSGPRHFAAAFDVPSLTLFGSTDPRWSDNDHAGEIILRESIPCSPCGHRECPEQHHDCMRQLTVERVWQTACRMLGHKERASDAA
jgi:heptosyltransferase-2